MRLEEHEVVTLLLGAGVLIFAGLRRKQLGQLPAAHWLLAGFAVLLAGWAAAVLAGVFAERSMYLRWCTYLEHACYAASAILIAGWSRLAVSRSQET